MFIDKKCEQIIASENQPVWWTTPLGLPVVQPYRKLGRHIVSVEASGHITVCDNQTIKYVC